MIINSDKCVIYFFFSSRRRHTRSYGDWSSDVCSSDLKTCGLGHRRACALRGAGEGRLGATARAWPRQALRQRSEERRVGKECRARWAAEGFKIKRANMMIRIVYGVVSMLACCQIRMDS